MPHSDVGPDLTFPGSCTVIDLRNEAQRQQHPLNAPRVLVLTLDAIEEGSHGLNAEQGPFVVVCERGTRSALAARYLRADGLDARAWADLG